MLSLAFLPLVFARVFDEGSLLAPDTAVGSCMDKADQALIKNGGAESALMTCDMDCNDKKDCLENCFVHLKYTRGCATCFADLVVCGADVVGKKCADECPEGKPATAGCKNCVETSCFPSFETCSGLKPELALTRSLDEGACADAADQAIWKGVGQTDFEGDLSACGNQCLGSAGCTAKCIVKRRGYTDACATCLGDLVGCTASNCRWDCAFSPHATKCKTCVDQNCTPAFETCSGLTPPN